MDSHNQAIFPNAELFLVKRFMESEYDISSSSWLLGTGLSEASFSDPDSMVSLFQFDIIHRNIFRLSNDAAVGLKFGLALNLSRWGMLSTALLSSKSLGSALRFANQFRALLRSRFLVSTIVEGDSVRINMKTSEAKPFSVNREFGYELFLGTLKSQIQDLLARSFQFSKIELDYPPPKHSKLYRHYLGCDIQFDCRESNIWIPLGVMSLPLPLANQCVAEQARKICENEITRIDSVLEGDLRWAVSRNLKKPDGTIRSLDEVSSILSVSSRTLRRNLNEKGTSFRDIVQQFKQQLASQLLIEANTPIKVIAEQCGYKDAVLFRAAFKRWFGVYPSVYRQEFRAG